MCQTIKINLVLIGLMSFSVFAQRIPVPDLSDSSFSYCNNTPRVPKLKRSEKSAAIIFIENGGYGSAKDAEDALKASGVSYTDEDLCYIYAPRWGIDKSKFLNNGSNGGTVVNYLEKGQRIGGCKIELYADLSFKTNEPKNAKTERVRNIRDDSVGKDWPMLDCTKVPPECDKSFSPLRISNIMQNRTDVGLVAGDKTVIVQQWTCIKI